MNYIEKSNKMFFHPFRDVNALREMMDAYKLSNKWLMSPSSTNRKLNLIEERRYLEA
jgi:hypothetical protein